VDGAATETASNPLQSINSHVSITEKATETSPKKESPIRSNTEKISWLSKIERADESPTEKTEILD